MPNEKEDLKNQLQSIKDNLDKKLSQKEAENKSKIEEKKDSNKEKNNKDLTKKKKPISISTEIEVVSDAKKENTKEQKNLKNHSKSIKPKLAKKKVTHKKKKKKLIIPIVLIVFLLLSLFYVYNLRKNLQQDKSKFEKEKKEAIDYSNDVFFKEVEDEVDDEEMQDFAVYKDVPEVVAESNSTSETLSAKDNKDINAQISQKVKEQNNTTKTQNSTTDTDIASNTTPDTNTDSKSTDNNTNTVSKPEEKPEEKTGIKKEEVFSDMIKVVGLQHKDGSFTVPKKVKKTNAFKIRVRLKKNEISNSDKDTNIMLVIKNAQGNTIKIDSKKINFGKQNSKVLYLEFYEIFPERLETNTNYSFSVFADKKLIKSYRKSI